MNWLIKWMTPGTGLGRWLILLAVGVITALVGTSLAAARVIHMIWPYFNPETITMATLLGLMILGITLASLSARSLLSTLLAPYQRLNTDEILDVVVDHRRRQRGTHLVAIGGGTGLPAVLRGMKHYTNHITAIVTVADDGGSSGRLRRDLGVPPLGDLRNNIAALADDSSLLTRLFQYRFERGDLAGHSVGNLFIAALSAIVQEESGDRRSSVARALVEIEQILNIRGTVLPATLDDVHLAGSITLRDSNRVIKVKGESNFETLDGRLEAIDLIPSHPEAYQPSIQAILQADVIVIGPGSLYTSVLPNLMIREIADALRASNAYKIYVCNVATQPVETDDYTVAEHVMALERHVGRGVFHYVLANNFYPAHNAGVTKYVKAAPMGHEIGQRYDVRYTDLTDAERPWRHDPHKLAAAILQITNQALSNFATSRDWQNAV